MSADFLTDSQVQSYGSYAAEPNEVQLARYFHLDERDLDFVNQRRGMHNRLGIALQLTTARFLGTFISDAMQIPAGVQHHVAAQLGIPCPEILSRYTQRENTRSSDSTMSIMILVNSPGHFGLNACCMFAHGSAMNVPA